MPASRIDTETELSRARQGNRHVFHSTRISTRCHKPPARRILKGEFLTEHGADLTTDEIELGRAMDKFKREHGKPHPTASDMCEVMRSLGYTLDFTALFACALAEYVTKFRRRNPTFSEVLAVAESIGVRKVGETPPPFTSGWPASAGERGHGISETADQFTFVNDRHVPGCWRRSQPARPASRRGGGDPDSNSAALAGQRLGGRRVSMGRPVATAGEGLTVQLCPVDDGDVNKSPAMTTSAPGQAREQMVSVAPIVYMIHRRANRLRSVGPRLLENLRTSVLAVFQAFAGQVACSLAVRVLFANRHAGEPIDQVIQGRQISAGSFSAGGSVAASTAALPFLAWPLVPSTAPLSVFALPLATSLDRFFCTAGGSGSTNASGVAAGDTFSVCTASCSSGVPFSCTALALSTCFRGTWNLAAASF